MKHSRMRMKWLAGLLSALMILNGLPMFAMAAEEEKRTVFTVSSASGLPGDTVELEISAAGNAPVSGLLLYGLTYDTDVLEFVSYDAFGTLVTDSITGENSVLNGNIHLDYSSAIIPAGEICSVVFRIKEGTADGEYTVGFSTFLAFDNGTQISCVQNAGKVRVSRWLEGDFDCNGIIDMKDAVHFMGWVNFSYIPGLYPMAYSGDKDFNHDGKVDMADTVYLIGWISFSSIAGMYDIDWYGTPAQGKGDLDGNGSVNYDDLVILYGHITGTAPITSAELLAAADVDASGAIDENDAAILVSMFGSKSDLRIPETTVNPQRGDPGTTFEWTAAACGGEGKVEYSFELNRMDAGSASAGNAASREYGPEGSFAVALYEAGTYAVTISCRDESGTVCTLSDILPVTVTNTEFDGIAVRADTGMAVCENMPIRWTVETFGGNAPFTYQYTLYHNNRKGTPVQSAESFYELNSCESGTYRLLVECTDAEGLSVIEYSETVTVSAAGDIYPHAPEVWVAEDGIVLAQTQEDAVQTEARGLELQWNAVPAAAEYALELSYYSGGQWITVHTADPVRDTRYTLPYSAFRSSAERLYRIGIRSRGIAEGEPRYYYLYVTPVTADETLTVNDGTEEIVWDIAALRSAERYFNVESALDYSVSSDAEWVTWNTDNNGFTVTVAENAARVASRTGNITVDNGANTVTIRINQGKGDGAPIVEYPYLSDDPAAPTLRPVGGITLKYDEKYAKYIGIRIFELTAAGGKIPVYENLIEKNTKSRVYIPEPNAEGTFHAGGRYVIELSGYYSPDYASNEVARDVERSEYFIEMTSGGHEILVNGTDYYEAEDFEEVAVYLYSTNTWTCSADADWIHAEDYLQTSYNNDLEEIEISLDPNYTSSTRFGILTFYCGDRTARVKITQDSWLPRVITPVLSTDMANPTVVPVNGLVWEDVYGRVTYATYSGGVWSDETDWSHNSSVSWKSDLLSDGYFETGVLYRFTLQTGEYTSTYYAKFTDSAQNYIVLRTDNSDDVTSEYLNVPAGQSGHEIKMKASASWTVTSDASWLTCSSASGSAQTSYKTLTVTTKENTTGKPRTGVLSFKIGTKVYATLTVAQNAADYLALFVEDPKTGDKYLRYDPETSFCLCDGAGDTLRLYAWTNDTWGAVCNSSWLGISGKSEITGKASGKYIDIKFGSNTGSSVRTGTVTVNAGNVSRTVTITQVPGLSAPTLVSPDFSTSSTNASPLIYDDIALTWNAVRGAAYYRIVVAPSDRTLLPPDSPYSYDNTVQDTGKSVYSCTIPRTAISLNADSYDYVSIYVYDEYGYNVHQRFYFAASLSNAARINGTMTPVWDNSTDIAVSRAFTVGSTAAWTARSDSAWITIDRASGVNGDILTVSLSANTGSARTGRVIVSVAGTETILTVNQCAYLPEFPSFDASMFSDDPDAPTILNTGTSSIRVVWNYEPQAEKYEVSLGRIKSATVETILDTVKCTGKNEYTFENLELTPGVRYSIKLTRSSHWGLTAKRCYFMINDVNAYVKVSGAENLEKELDPGEDSVYTTVTSSGTWSAVVSADWLMVDNEAVTQADLDRDGYTSGDFASYTGIPGGRLCISALPNPGNTYRYGTVTVRSSNAAATVTIIQEPYYETAEIISPVLSTDREAPVGVPYGNVTFRWTPCVGGAGTYQIALEEREQNTYSSYSSYSDILEDTYLTGTSYTIPAGKLREGGYYRVKLYSDLVGLDRDESPRQTYYFYVKYDNALTVSADVVWNTDGQVVEITASAVGGAGGYNYAYELLRSGKQVDITTWENMTYYTFDLNEEGEYQVRVYCKDAADFRDTMLSAVYEYNGAPADAVSISENSWTVGTSGGSKTITVHSNAAWVIESIPDWISCSSSEGRNGDRIVLSAKVNNSTGRTGIVTFVSGAARQSLTVTQESAVLRPVIVYPFNDAGVDAADLSVNWNPIPEASFYRFSARDLRTDTLLYDRVPVSGGSFTIPASSLLAGHRYRIAVGAVVGSETWWTESYFNVSVPEGGQESADGEESTVHDYQRVTVSTKMLICDDDYHEVITVYYEKCSICGDTTAQKTDSQKAAHSFKDNGGYESMHEHKKYKECVCGAAQLIPGEYQTANGQVQEPGVCCICHGHAYDESNPQQVNGKWYVYCTKCGISKNVPAPSAPTPAVCTHPNGFTMLRNEGKGSSSVNVNQKYYHITHYSTKMVLCCAICGQESGDPPINVTLPTVGSPESRMEAHTFNRNAKCTVCGYQSNEGVYDCTKRYQLYFGSYYYMENGKHIYTGVEEPLSVFVYDQYQNIVSPPSGVSDIDITLKDPEGISVILNDTYIAYTSGNVEVVLSYLGKEVDSVEISVTVLSVEDTLFNYNIDARGVVRLEDMDRVDWKDCNVMLTSTVAMGKYTSQKNHNGSYTVSFEAYNCSAEIFGFTVYDNNGNRTAESIQLVEPYWGTGSFVLSMWETFMKTTQIWNSRSFDGSGTETTKITMTIPEGGYFRLVDLSEDEDVLFANLGELIVSFVKVFEDGKSIVDPADAKLLRTALESIGKKELASIIKEFCAETYKQGIKTVIKESGTEILIGAGKDVAVEAMIQTFFADGMMEAILSDLPGEIAKTLVGKIEDLALAASNIVLYYIKQGGQIALDMLGMSQLVDAFIRFSDDQTAPRTISYFLIPFQEPLTINMPK